MIFIIDGVILFPTGLDPGNVDVRIQLLHDRIEWLKKKQKETHQELLDRLVVFGSHTRSSIRSCGEADFKPASDEDSKTGFEPSRETRHAPDEILGTKEI